MDVGRHVKWENNDDNPLMRDYKKGEKVNFKGGGKTGEVGD